MKKLLALLLPLPLALAGCSSLTAQQKALVTGSVSKTVIETADRELWGPYVESQTDACDPESNPAIKTQRDFDACLGPALADEQVLKALEVYVVAADALFSMLKSGNAQSAELQAAKQRALDAATAVLEVMGPIAEKQLADLRAITKK